MTVTGLEREAVRLVISARSEVAQGLEAIVSGSPTLRALVEGLDMLVAE